MAKKLSTNVSDELATAIQNTAKNEGRPVSEVIEAALLLFADLPKPLRDALIELRGSNPEMLQDMSRETMAYIARRKFDAGMGEIAPYFVQEGDADLTDQELLERSTDMTRGS